MSSGNTSKESLSDDNYIFNLVASASIVENRHKLNADFGYAIPTLEGLLATAIEIIENTTKLKKPKVLALAVGSGLSLMERCLLLLLPEKVKRHFKYTDAHMSHGFNETREQMNPHLQSLGPPAEKLEARQALEKFTNVKVLLMFMPPHNKDGAKEEQLFAADVVRQFIENAKSLRASGHEGNFSLVLHIANNGQGTGTPKLYSLLQQFFGLKATYRVLKYPGSTEALYHFSFLEKGIKLPRYLISGKNSAESLLEAFKYYRLSKKGQREWKSAKKKYQAIIGSSRMSYYVKEKVLLSLHLMKVLEGTFQLLESPK